MFFLCLFDVFLRLRFIFMIFTPLFFAFMLMPRWRYYHYACLFITFTPRFARFAAMLLLY